MGKLLISTSPVQRLNSFRTYTARVHHAQLFPENRRLRLRSWKTTSVSSVRVPLIFCLLILERNSYHFATLTHLLVRVSFCCNKSDGVVALLAECLKLRINERASVLIPSPVCLGREQRQRNNYHHLHEGRPVSHRRPSRDVA